MLKASVARLAKRKDREFQTVAGALSRWAWQQRKLPGRLWFDVVDLFRANAMLRGTLRIGGQPVRLDRITVPTLVMVTDRDHIVPIASSLALTRVIPHAQVVRAPAGHVSMLMGHEARSVTIPAIASFINAASAPPPAPPAAPAPKPVPRPKPRKAAPRTAAPRRAAPSRDRRNGSSQVRGA
ncbi:MAG TPA: hypothetical protein VNA20_12565 [Frankiaceae bacterium]|nr:hypothetical protein [Frankiaceae bacterium]